MDWITQAEDLDEPDDNSCSQGDHDSKSGGAANENSGGDKTKDSSSGNNKEMLPGTERHKSEIRLDMSKATPVIVELIRSSMIPITQVMQGIRKKTKEKALKFFFNI